MLLKLLSVALTCWITLFTVPGKRTVEQTDTCKQPLHQQIDQPSTGFELSTVDYLVLSI